MNVLPPYIPGSAASKRRRVRAGRANLGETRLPVARYGPGVDVGRAADSGLTVVTRRLSRSGTRPATED